MKKNIIIIVLLNVTPVFILSTGCKRKDDSARVKAKPAPAVRVITASQGAISKLLELTGSVTATRVARIGSPAEGPVADCSMREGDRVHKGQVLLKIGRRKAADAFVEAARESLRRETEELRRTEKLVESGAIAAEEIDIARLRVSRAKAELSKAMESAGDYEIEAPWQGIVSRVYVRDGYFVAPREPLVEIYDPCSLAVQFHVPETQATMVKSQMVVKVNFDVCPEREFEAIVSRTYPQVNEITRTRTVEAELAEEDDVSLLPGMFARVRLLLDTVENAVLVPEKAVLVTFANEHILFVVNNGKAALRKIKTGYEQSRAIQITEGLQAGETVVIEGNEQLKDGSQVKIIGGQNK